MDERVEMIRDHESGRYAVEVVDIFGDRTQVACDLDRQQARELGRQQASWRECHLIDCSVEHLSHTRMRASMSRLLR